MMVYNIMKQLFLCLWRIMCGVAGIFIEFWFGLILKDFIINRVIPNFHGQRQEGYQFAVLILAGKLKNLHFYPNHNGTPLVDNTFPMYPLCPGYPNQPWHVNYLVARPLEIPNVIRRVHCEETLFSHLHCLQVSCEQHVCKAEHIILYSWMQPCTTCTTYIIDVLQANNFQQARKTIAYTIEWEELSAQANWQNRQRLINAGIHIQKVVYPHWLPPA